MKKITFYDCFLLFAIILFAGSKDIYTSIILMCASVLELIDVVPKMVRLIKDGSE